MASASRLPLPSSMGPELSTRKVWPEESVRSEYVGREPPPGVVEARAVAARKQKAGDMGGSLEHVPRRPRSIAQRRPVADVQGVARRPRVAGDGGMVACREVC